jgi:hypothetical protein
VTTACADCAEIIDPRKLVRGGTNQVERASAAPDPARVPVDERRAEHAMVFAAAYSSYLKYFDATNAPSGDWKDFFASDRSVQLATAAVADVDVYRSTVKSYLRSLEDPEVPVSAGAMIAALRAIFDLLGSLARRLDALKRELPSDHPVSATLRNLIRTQLSPMFRRLIGYYKAGQGLGVVVAGPPTAGINVLGRPVESFGATLSAPLSPDWVEGAKVDSWTTYVGVNPAPYASAYGAGPTAVDYVNHLGTHNLFTAICETFLRAFARVSNDAKSAVQATFEWRGHEPHYALFLSFLRLLEHARAEANNFTTKHLDFYYRDVLRLQERSALPSHAHVLVELAKNVESALIPTGTLLKAGKDDKGADAQFATERDLVANRARVTALESVYRHKNKIDDTLPFQDGRIFASPVANSDDGLGAKLTTLDQSWHPFANKIYRDGALNAIRMPPAEIGFAIASHYLWMAEGTRTITIELDALKSVAVKVEPQDLVCQLTTEKGWLDKPIDEIRVTPKGLSLTITLDGNDPPITPYVPKTHGYELPTSFPVLIVKLRHRDAPFRYDALARVTLTAISLTVEIRGLKTLTISNDLGPVDSSKPFQAFGPKPIAKSALVIGSKEVFQKRPSSVTLQVSWASTPSGYLTTPRVAVDYLDAGAWKRFGNSLYNLGVESYRLQNIPLPQVTPDLATDVDYTTSSRSGFIRLRLGGGFGLDAYAIALAQAIVSKPPPPSLPTPPVVPTMSSLGLDYTATQRINLKKRLSKTAASTRAHFFHLTPFGHAEQLPPAPGQGPVALFPQFNADRSHAAEAELYVGVSDLLPPQNLALLFQVVDGTANPLVVKPEEHIRWSYLHGIEWVPFASDAVDDRTNGLLESGIVTLAVPADASNDSTLLPAGRHWIRLAVASASDAVCRLVAVAAQALRAGYVVRDNGAAFGAGELPAGTITKLDQPDADVKRVTQPFPSFGGRAAETSSQFATRVSERLRHKDRAIALWDYEHLVLNAFPSIYQARCLNHTQYEPSAAGTGIYRELAPGHVTIVTIPDAHVPNPRDPLRPYTSLGVLADIERFLAQRMSCCVNLHVRNPQFEEVSVELRVRLRERVDETFYVNQLKNEITRFLSPWAFRSDACPTFNGKIYRSVLVDFIEEREYVDYVTDVWLSHRYLDRGPGGALTPVTRTQLDSVEGARAISILVSVPAVRHVIRVIHPDTEVADELCACAPQVD